MNDDICKDIIEMVQKLKACGEEPNMAPVDERIWNDPEKRAAFIAGCKKFSMPVYACKGKKKRRVA